MGIETVVRPVVFPNIRPAPAQPQRSAGGSKAVIHGASGQHIDLPMSWSVSSSTSRSVEQKRRVDEVRVYQMDEDQNVNRDNFVDIKVANKIWMKDGQKATTYAYPKAVDDVNQEVIRKDTVIFSEYAEFGG